MPVLKLEADNTTAIGTTSGTATMVGNGTAIVLSTTDGQDFDGTFALQILVDGKWVIAQLFPNEGVFPGFNGVSAEYRLALAEAPGAGKSGKIVLNGDDKRSDVYY